MWNHRGEWNCRQPYDEWSYSNPSSPPPFLFSLISADIPCTYMANHRKEHGEIIFEKQCTPSRVCPFGVRIIICKWQRAATEAEPEVCYLKSENIILMMLFLCAMLKVLFPPFSSDLSLEGKWKGENMLQVKSIIKIPYFPWCVQLVFCRVLWPPMVFPVSNQGGKNRELCQTLGWGMPGWMNR